MRVSFRLSGPNATSFSQESRCQPIQHTHATFLGTIHDRSHMSQPNRWFPFMNIHSMKSACCAISFAEKQRLLDRCVEVMYIRTHVRSSVNMHIRLVVFTSHIGWHSFFTLTVPGSVKSLLWSYCLGLFSPVIFSSHLAILSERTLAIYRVKKEFALTFFTARHSARIASAVLAIAIPSVRPSVWHTPVGIVSKRLNVGWCSLHWQIAKCS